MARTENTIASETIYADASGKAVKAGDPRATIKIVNKGGLITAALEKRYPAAFEKAAADKKEDDEAAPAFPAPPEPKAKTFKSHK